MVASLPLCRPNRRQWQATRHVTCSGLGNGNGKEPGRLAWYEKNLVSAMVQHDGSWYVVAVCVGLASAHMHTVMHGCFAT